MPLPIPPYVASITKEVWEELARQIDNPMVVRAHTLTNVVGDAGVKIAAAIAMLPPGIGGLVDATGFTNPQNLTGFTIPPGVTVQLGPVFFTMPTASPSIVVNQGARLLGMGANSPGSTQIKAFTGFNKDVIKCISTAGESNWWHNGRVSNIRIDANKAQNASGHAVSVYGLAEASTIDRLSVLNAPQAGLYIKGSQSGTGSIENVTVNASGLYGIQLDQFRSGITLKCVGGDQNPITFAITDPSMGGGSILLIDPKSEGTVAIDPEPVIQIGGGSAPVTLTIVGGNFTTPNQNKTAIRILPGTVAPHIQIMGLASGNSFTTLLDDQVAGVQVTTDPLTYHALFCYHNGKYMRFDQNGFTTVP